MLTAFDGVARDVNQSCIILPPFLKEAGPVIL